MLGDDIVLVPVTNFTPSVWSWTPDDFLSCTDCPNPTAIQPNQSIEYFVIATDDFGCSVSTRTRLEFEKQFNVFVPEAFSPNDDGINDVFQFFAGTQAVLVRNFAVFDRWGNQV